MTLSFDLVPSLAAQLTTLAEQRGNTLESLVLTIIMEYLDTHAIVTETDALQILQGDADVFSEGEIQRMLYGLEDDLAGEAPSEETA